MDKKKKNGAAATISSTTAPDSRDRSRSGADALPLNSKPIPIAAASGPEHNGSSKSKASAAPSSGEKGNAPNKNAHTPEDASKPGPQKKRRKVTHGTALTYYIVAFQPDRLSAPVVAPQGIELCVVCLRALILCLSRSYSLCILPSICKSNQKNSPS